ncbi:hypothetical protein [Herbaspirillum autotrophicum]|uniref:hypothetical protein n=1 Tax=Herbaspirillum autotrophicum TaxID=180195 RepID=UPI000AF40E12
MLPVQNDLIPYNPLPSDIMLTYAIQKAGYDYDQLDQQGAIDFDGFMHAINTFPWAEQLRAWDETQDGPLPSLVLQNEKDERALWVMVIGSDLGNSFQVTAVWMRPHKGMFGLGKEKMVQETATIDIELRQELDQLCRLFCAAQYEDLERDVARFSERSS